MHSLALPCDDEGTLGGADGDLGGASCGEHGVQHVPDGLWVGGRCVGRVRSDARVLYRDLAAAWWRTLVKQVFLHRTE